MADRAQAYSLSMVPVEATPVPAATSLLCLGATVFLVGLDLTGLLLLDIRIVGVGLFIGGMSQILAGFHEWSRNNAFGSVTFFALGLFWHSLIAMLLLPRSGFGPFPDTSATTSYLFMWGVFSLLLCCAASQTGRRCQATLGLLSGFLMLMALALATGSRPLQIAGGCLGLTCGTLALFTGIDQLLQTGDTKKG